MCYLEMVGRVYEYFLGKFAASEGKGGGEFYIPKDVVNLIAEIAGTYQAWKREREWVEAEKLDGVICQNLEVLGYGK